MKPIIPLATAIAMLAATSSFAQETTQVSPPTERASMAGPAENFTGTVTVTPLFDSNELSNATGGLVEFTPGARTAWHTHPAGQTLIITSGIGWVQEEGGERLEVRAGDVVRFPSNVRHWHGATTVSSMTHIAISPVEGDSNVTWEEQVSDEEYGD